MSRHSRRNIQPHRTARATLFTTLLIILLLSLYAQPSSTSPVPIPTPRPIPIPSIQQQTPFDPFDPLEPEHHSIVGELQPSTSASAGSNPEEPNNSPGSTGTGSIPDNRSDETPSPPGLTWTHLSSVFVNEVCKNDGRAILLGFLIGCLGTWLIHILVQRYFLKRGWGFVLWPSRRTRRHWARRDRHRNLNGTVQGNENTMTGGGEAGPHERNSDRQVPG
ncbi:hypothetical protein V8F20_001739 [Naviculisporaceae sp. PSN 640]